VKYGLYHEELISLTKKGKAGLDEIHQMMHAYRTNPPKSITGIAVEQIDDFESKISRLANGTQKELVFPKSNVLRFILSDGSQIAVRPSGTEPKIKFYFSVNTKLKNAAAFDATKKILADQCQKLTQSLGI
jgi:phosphoglucomutase